MPAHGPLGSEIVPRMVLAVPSPNTPVKLATGVMVGSSIPALTSEPAIKPVSNARILAELKLHVPEFVKVALPLSPKVFGGADWLILTETPIVAPPAINEPVYVPFTIGNWNPVMLPCMPVPHPPAMLKLPDVIVLPSLLSIPEMVIV